MQGSGRSGHLPVGLFAYFTCRLRPSSGLCHVLSPTEFRTGTLFRHSSEQVADGA